MFLTSLNLPFIQGLGKLADLCSGWLVRVY